MKSKRHSKCIARPWGESNWCDGCSKTTTKCPYRYKTRDLRHTKKGRAYRGETGKENENL